MASQATPLKLVRAFAAVTAEAAAPTTASAFVDFNDVGGQHFGKLKLVANLHTFNSTPTSYIIQVWYKAGDVVVAGPRVSTTTAQGPFAELDCGVVPGESVYATLISLTGGSAPALTMNLYGFKYNDLD